MENWNSDQHNPEQKADAFVNGQNGQNAAEQNTAANTPEGQNAGAQNQTQPDGAYSYGPRQAPTGGNPYDTQAGNVGGAGQPVRPAAYSGQSGERNTGAYRPTYQQPDYYGYSGTYTGHAYTQPPKAKAHKKNKAKIWVPIVIVAAMLVGVAGGFGINELVSRRKADTQTEVQSQTERNGATEAKTEETQGSGDLSHKVTTAPTTGALTPSEIYSKYVNAVVGIANEGTTTNYFGQVSATASSGTGFIITEDGYILTNHHVVEGAKTLTVTLNDGTEYPATLVGSESTICDVALLKIDATGLTTVDIGDSDSLQVGEEVCTIGNPLGELTNTLTVGYISAKDREINTDGTPINMMQTDAAINSGNSGGPLFDMNGNVVGITTAKYSGETNSGTVIEGLGFAIPINDVMDIVDDLQQYGYLKNRAYMGVRVADSASVTNQNLPAGAYISSVESGSCAEAAGLQAGDVIVGIGDTVIGSYNDLAAALNTYKSGDTTRVTVYRSGSYVDTQITFDERPRQTEEETQETESGSNYGYGYGGNGFGFMFP